MALEPLDGLRVVDLYAGSGALGIEALSRGAARVVFVERERAARAALERNLTDLELTDRAVVWRLVLPAGLGRIDPALAEADLVLMDPPYGSGRAAGTLARLGEPGRLRHGARVVVEHHARDVLPERSGALARARERRYGETVVSTYRVAAEGTTAVAPEEGGDEG